MAEDRHRAALQRIDAALARIEAAAQRPAPATADASSVADEDHHRLLLAHAALRDAVTGAMARLDTLVAAEER